MTPDRRVNDERLDNIEAQLRTLTDAVNALARQQRPSAFVRFFSQTPVILAAFTGMISFAVVTTRLVFSVLGQAEQLAVARNTVVPNAWANFETLAAVADQVCVVAAKPHGATCQRIQLKSPDMTQSTRGIYSALLAIPHLRGTP